VRGKGKIREAKIPFVVPALADLPDRLDAVLTVVYLVFHEGYAASSGAVLTRPDLSHEAIRLGRILVEMLPDAETLGLLALMLLHDSRRLARASDAGDLILLDQQDRTRWNQAQIAEGVDWVRQAVAMPPIGSYAIQAAIASVHAQASEAGQTNWREIVVWYDLQLRANPSPIVELNRAVAVAMRDGPQVGLLLIDAILERGDLADYHLGYAAKADMLRRLERYDAARVTYRLALERTQQEPERRFIEQRLRDIS